MGCFTQFTSISSLKKMFFLAAQFFFCKMFEHLN